MNELNLIWVDMEMSGLNPETERILEVAVVVTDPGLNTLAIAPVMVIHQSDSILDAMDSWNKGTHGKSGLIDKVKASTTTEEEASLVLLDFLKGIVLRERSPCAAIRCIRIVVSCNVICRSLSSSFTTETLMSAQSKSSAVVGIRR